MFLPLSLAVPPMAEHFTGTDPDLEDGGSAGDGGGDRHEGHDFLFAAAGEAREETADGLDAILGIAGETNDRLGNFGDFGTATASGCSES